ncbi:HET-C domain-containing protein HetC [Trichophyton interdigitale]|uniref:HET-C domain-containing protein HetC n=1 Tax=Trichophyton interdigitale TaxID=101480 RepID=A0A9P5D215_9EURO|nr:HET-C domain-containing protein HetC [Trichophyton interdigitale]KAF3901168.1 HET-C domain-containing protein HetC [Trichophyton interdigitale]KAG8211967.1 HET-C domain-containing protein HetC [Trichophyton interdigitale]
MGFNPTTTILLIALLLVVLPARVEAFGAGNIASVSAIEGKNWRHGDIEDVIKTLAFIKGHKWTANMVKRVYFGNWLRDYSQAVDVGTLKNVPVDSVRVLVWVLSFMTFGYATAEFEVTSERLGVYRPEEHIDNPKGYADDADARQYDPRLRGPVQRVELEIDHETGMKNYIANERGNWATSAGYVKYSFSRSIHFARQYINGGHLRRGKDEDLYEALRCLGQGLHTLEDFGAHTNYCELVLREMGMLNVFPHTGTNTMMNIKGKHVFPLVTGTFGMVDFLHSVLGEASDHVTQSEISELDTTLENAEVGGATTGSVNALTSLLSKVPGMGDLIAEAEKLKASSQAQAQANSSAGYGYGGASRGFDDGQAQAYGAAGGYDQATRAGPGGLPSVDPQKVISQIYPILVFRDNVVRRISSVVSKIPGLESLVEKITDTLSVFIFSLLSPFVRPLIKVATSQLQTGSSGVISTSEQHQYEPWTDPNCTDPTHSLLSKDHFSNILNEPAGHVAAAILKYVVPRVLYAWQHVDIPVDDVLADCMRVFHHPALRDMNNEAHRTMFEAVQNWARSRRDGGSSLDTILNAQSVREGKNHTGGNPHLQGGGHGHGSGHGSGHGYGQQPMHGAAHGYQPPYQQQQQHQSYNSPPYGQQSYPHQGGGGSSHHSSNPLSNIPGLSALAGFAGNSSHQGAGHSHAGSAAASIPWDKLSHLPIPGASNLGKIGGFLSGSGGRTRDLGDEASRGIAPEEHPASRSTTPQPDMPPPAGYERYHQQREGNPVYEPPSEGAHTYDYYYGPGHNSGYGHSHQY